MIEGRPLTAGALATEFDLSNKRNEIDSQVLKIYDNEQRSKKARKALAGVTKELGAASGAEKIKRIRPVLRSYQREIDHLTKRARFAEDAFVAVYKSLYDAPDPAPLLVAAAGHADRVRTADSETASLRAKLLRYESELKSLKNQEVTVKTLRAQNAEYKQRMAEMESSARAREKQLVDAESAALKRTLQQQELAHSNSLDHVQTALARATASQQRLQSKLFDVSEKQENVEAASDAHAEMLQQELDAASSLITTLQRDKEDLISQLHAAQDATQLARDASKLGGSGSREADLASQTLRLEAELKATADRAEEQRSTFEAKLKACGEETAQHKAMAEAASARAAQMKSRLESLPTPEEYSRLKKRVALLCEMGFDVKLADADVNAGADATGAADTDTDRTAEEMMMIREARRLRAEITRNRVGWAECKEQLKSTSEQLTETEAELKRARELAAKLEDDLAAAAAGTVDTTDKDDKTTDPIDDEAILSHALGPAGAGGAAASPARVRATRTASSGSSGGESAMLAIVCSQRDRFRKRIQQLETEQITAHAMRKDLQRQMKRLRGENIQLYEKLQYVQSYKNDSKGGTNGGDIESGALKTDAKYKALYDDASNPFQKFRQKQREKQYKSMSVQDKLINAVGEILISKNSGRMGLFVYSLALHFLVFFTLWRYTHIPPCPPPGR